MRRTTESAKAYKENAEYFTQIATDLSRQMTEIEKEVGKVSDMEYAMLEAFGARTKEKKPSYHSWEGYYELVDKYKESYGLE